MSLRSHPMYIKQPVSGSPGGVVTRSAGIPRPHSPPAMAESRRGMGMGAQAARLVLQPGIIMGLASCVFLEVQGKSVCVVTAPF